VPVILKIANRMMKLFLEIVEDEEANALAFHVGDQFAVKVLGIGQFQQDDLGDVLLPDHLSASDTGRGGEKADPGLFSSGESWRMPTV
jgi:hypothetical protein